MKRSTEILRWYDKHGRDLPWRKTRNPYKILVSEIMLQQTQVDRVKDFYRRWLKQFPTFESLASASRADVLRTWSGLGYNRRALALQAIAKQVAEDRVPLTKEAWLKLKGVGPYTSSAVALFAQRERTFPVDSVLRRIGGRLLLGIPFAGAKQDEKIQKRGVELLRETDRYDEVVQALFDLATEICSKEPKCAVCPLKKECKASSKFLSGKVKIPKRSLPKAKERVHVGKRYPDRIYRGRILKVVAASQRPLSLSVIAREVDLSYRPRHDKEWFTAMLTRLERDGMLEKTSGGYRIARQ